MKLLSCYIVGFGKFVNTSFDLSKPLLVLKAENGWGKTTLAAFIESMLYGFEGRSKAVSANERLKYEPWSGGAYGGSLTFLYAGRTLRVERTFGKTPAGDTVKIYDGNNMPCYDFGARAERLGETLLSVDRESYRRCVYIPQGEIQTGELPETLRGRLIALLSASSQTENGAQSAIERLENAERALRAKRKPAKGRLDEIDERLETLARQKEEMRRAIEERERIARATSSASARLAELARETNGLYARLQEITRKNELAANRAAREEILYSLQETKRTCAELEAFFAGIDPATLNTEGLQNAVKEFYEIQEELTVLEPKLRALGERTREKQNVLSQLQAAEKTVASYELFLLSKPEKEGAGTSASKENRKKRKNGFTVLLIIAFAAVLLGAIFVSANPTLGVALFAVGVLGTVTAFFILFSGLSQANASRGKLPLFEDETLTAKYAAAKAEEESLRVKLAAFPLNIEEAYSAEKEGYEQKRARAEALRTGIEGFLGNFRFGETYDYRAALQILKSRAEAYAEKRRALEEGEKRLAGFAELENTKDVSNDNEAYFSDGLTSVEALHARRTALEEERERLTADRARGEARLEELERLTAELAEYQSEESFLIEEKTRLEKRLHAIRTAKELILRAGETMATRYLLPVEKNCKKYAETLGFNGEERRLCFGGDGAPVVEERGGLRVTEYYSAGTKSLIGFCVRIALAEAIFKGEKPPLLLDDPFTDFDDEKTEKAKAFVKELSKTYQVLYFTCKTEREM